MRYKKHNLPAIVACNSRSLAAVNAVTKGNKNRHLLAFNQEDDSKRRFYCARSLMLVIEDTMPMYPWGLLVEGNNDEIPQIFSGV